jgi:arsenate reductase
MLKVLILCTGNSCRSIMAEALLNHYGKDKFIAFSAGSSPTGKVHPKSLATLTEMGLPTEGYRSKSWDEFADQPIDIVITVCDQAAGEICPVFFGKPVKAHWSIPDPAHFEGSEAEINAEFKRVYRIIETLIKAMVSLHLEDMAKEEIAQKLNDIGQMVNV